MLGFLSKSIFKPKENYEKFYEHHEFGAFPEEHACSADNIMGRVKWGLDYATVMRPKRVLDLGCLDGFNLCTLAAKAGITGVGVDLSEEGINLATARADRYDLPLEFVKDSAEHFLKHYKGEKFDMVCMHEFIEHVKDPDTLLKLVNKVVAPEGMVFVSTPDFDGGYGRGNQDPCHLRIYTVKRGSEVPEYTEKPVISLAEQVEANGGIVVENFVNAELVQVQYTV